MYIAFSLIMGIWGANFYVVLISVFFIYACSTTLYAALIVLLAETDPRSTNRFSNIISLVNSLGCMIYPIFLGFLMGRGMSWRGHYLILSALVGLTLLAFFFITPQKTYQVELKKDEPGKKFQWKDSRFWMLCALLFLNVVVETSLGYFIKPFFSEELHSATGAAICISLLNCGMLPSKLFASRVRRKKREMLLYTFLALAATIQALAVEIFPEHSGKVSMLLLPFNGIASAAATVFMGGLSDRIGPGNAFYPLVAIALLSAVPAYLFMKDKRREQDESAL